MGLADYQATVEGIEAVFPAHDTLFLFYEDLFSEASLQKLCAFSGAEYGPPESREAVNETSLKIDLPDPVRGELRKILDRQYEFCRNRFKKAVLASWSA